MNIFQVSLKPGQRIFKKDGKTNLSPFNKLSDLSLQARNYIKPRLVVLPIFSLIFGWGYKTQRQKHQHHLPQLSGAEDLILSDLEAQGIHQSDLASLSISGAEAMVAKAKSLLLEHQTNGAVAQNRFTVPQDIASQDPDISLWGLNESLLNIIESYIGLPIYYLGAEIKRELADGETAGVRKWHIDPEDHRMVKIIVYLNSVDKKGGPFEYIPKELTRRAVSRTRYTSGLISDKTLGRVMRQTDCQVCIGDEGTVAFFDGCSIFHRAQPPLEHDRDSITFHYISKHPIIFRTQQSFGDLGWIKEKLTDRQRSCLM